jgi:hypothetical protein
MKYMDEIGAIISFQKSFFFFSSEKEYLSINITTLKRHVDQEQMTSVHGVVKHFVGIFMKMPSSTQSITSYYSSYSERLS